MSHSNDWALFQENIPPLKPSKQDRKAATQTPTNFNPFLFWISEIVAQLRALTVIPLYLATLVLRHDADGTRDVIVRCTRITSTSLDFELHSPERDAPEQDGAEPHDHEGEEGDSPAETHSQTQNETLNWSQGASDQEQLLENLSNNAVPPPAASGEGKAKADDTTKTEAVQSQADETAGDEVIFVEEEPKQDLPEAEAVTDNDVILAEVIIESPPVADEQQNEASSPVQAGGEQGNDDVIVVESEVESQPEEEELVPLDMRTDHVYSQAAADAPASEQATVTSTSEQQSATPAN